MPDVPGSRERGERLEVRATTGPSFQVLRDDSRTGEFGEVHWLDHSPMYWWPQDRAWFLSTGIDAQSTYIAGGAGLIDRLLSDPGLK